MQSQEESTEGYLYHEVDGDPLVICVVQVCLAVVRSSVCAESLEIFISSYTTDCQVLV